MRRTLLAIALPAALCFASAQAHENNDGDHDISKVNGGITAEAGQHYGDLDTVNGGISIEKGATADKVETVNGGITVDDEAKLRSLETVNGSIHVGQHVQVENGAETVNGALSIDFNSRLGGDVSTVNGGITIKQSEVGGQVETVGGDITIGAKSVIHGGIHVDKQHGISFGHQRTPRIVIGPNATVEGTLRFDREVELFVHPTAHVGTVVGATAQSWTDTLPPRKD